MNTALLLPLLLSFFFPLHSPATSQYTIRAQGEWRLLHESVGISAMHMQLLHNNKVIMFDRTDFGSSNLSLPNGGCRVDPSDTVLQTDCSAHSILYDVATNGYRPLTVQTDTWCSSGAVLPNGNLVQTGGYNDGERVVRLFAPCDNEKCDWIEYPQYLIERRWYATNQILPDGRIIIVGGRRQFNFEFYPRNINLGDPSTLTTFRLNFLRDTRDGHDENNLYPFLHLLPDGNLFIFANTRSILLDYNRNQILKEFPSIPGDDPRNYPSSGSSVLLPLDENLGNNIQVDILVCGGAPRGSFARAAQRDFLRSSSSCGRLRVSDRNPNWIMQEMPIPRVMGDMLLLPTGDVIIINGAELGTAGWEDARAPVTRPVIYRPSEHQSNWRFAVMAPSPRPRMYHSSAILLADGRVLVGGSNPHMYYNFSGVAYPTDLSLESFSPPYLSIEYDTIRPKILSRTETIGYGKPFMLRFVVKEYLTMSLVSLRILAPSFTTHSFAMNQRMVVLKVTGISYESSDTFLMNAVGPSKAEIAPPGHYLLFVVHSGIPSHGVWVRIQ
ncbi:Glyoxal oxidase-related protein [Tripterygium wilfordii]|uniref:Glyoxal oxidase-related protein n=1 Tax=Tripterygium wilfordii TaxID=458696 RepID=A0A7J7CZM2_TRIWF|nr:Glyoxal oxidase-related protein [Tripterygium wilfordii]